MIRLGLLASALAVAAGCGTASAADPGNGTAAPGGQTWDAYVSGAAGGLWIDDYGTQTAPQLQGRVTAAVDSGNGLGVQVDGRVTYDHLSYPAPWGDISYFMDLDLALHAYARDPSRGLIGVIGQVSTNRNDYPGDSLFSRYYAGIEGQAYLSDLTLYVQAAYKKMSYESGGDHNGFIVKVEPRYFLTDNLVVKGRLSYEQDRLPDWTVKTTTLGAGMEYKLPDSQVSLFLNADWLREAWSGPTANYGKVMVGVKFDIGTDSLKTLDRQGATLDPFDTNVYPPGGIPN